MKFSNPSCLNCNSLIYRDDINLNTDIASCKQCGTIYKFSNLLYSKQSNAHKDIDKEHEGFLYEDFKLVPSITINLKELSNYKFQFLMAALLWAMAIIFCIIPSLIAKFFGVVMLYLAIYLTKEGIYKYKTIYTIELGQDKFRVLESGKQTYSTIPDKIAQVYVKRRDGESSNKKKYFEHDILLRPKSGEDIKLIKHILPSSVAFQIERIIEKTYGIEDIITIAEYHPTYSPDSSTEIPPKALEILENLQKIKSNE